MLTFITFKSKEFISLISLCPEKSKSKRCLSQLQTKVNRNNHYSEYSIHERTHREEKELNRILPAVVDSNGNQDWYKNGKCHRDDLDENGRVLPAIIWRNGESNGSQFWYKNGKYHRDDRDENGRVLPAIVESNGSQYWYNDGKCHRDDRDEKGRVLPAVIKSNGGKEWYKNGKYHRDDRDENGRVLPNCI